MIKAKTALVYSAALNVLFISLIVMVNTLSGTRISKLEKESERYRIEVIEKQKAIRDSVITANLVIDKRLNKTKASNDSLELITEADRISRLRLRKRVYELESKSFRNVSDSAVIGFFSGIRFNSDSL